jgi:polyhydroxyalkanoate synthesis regulator phasin
VTSFWATEEGKRLTVARSASHHAATKRLKENHATEYAELLAAERVSRGLPPETEKGNVDLLKARIAELESELEARP